MLNQDKIKLMTKAASFEAGEGKKALAMNRYFRGDYISLQLIGAWISYTVAFVLCVGLWAFYHMEELMNHINKMDLPAMGRHVALLYLALLALYLVINYIVCHYRYLENRKSLVAYYQILKRISHIYQTESKGGSPDYTAAEGEDDDDDLTGV